MLVNNAGIMRGEDVSTGSVATAEATTTTNLLGPIRMTTALLGHLLGRPRSAVLNVTSGLAFVPMSATPTYSATKAALHVHSTALRKQLEHTSLEIIELIPPYVRTGLTGEAHARDERAMPLESYIAATMEILAGGETAEVVIDAVAPLRHAEAQGAFDETLDAVHNLGRERDWS